MSSFSGFSAPYPADHAQGGLLKHKMIQVRWPEALPKSVRTPKFASWCAKKLGCCGDLHHWLARNL